MSFLPENPQSNSSQNPTILTGSSSDLLWRTLSTLLALDSCSLTLSTGSSRLGLLSLLCALGGSTLVLALLDSGLASSGTGLWSLVSSLLDNVEGSTNDGTLGLDGTARTLLGNFLYAQNMVSPHASYSFQPQLHGIHVLVLIVPQRYPFCVVF